jgi:outer membrane lipase/esterase
MRKISAGLGLSLALFGGQALAQQAEFDGLVVFGDSLSDNGNIPKLFGIPYPHTMPGYDGGRFSNGPVYAEYLNSLLGIPGPLEDYAIGGATTGTTNIGGLPNAGITQEIARYLATDPRPTNRDLFVLWGGANDYFGYFDAIQACNGNPTCLAGLPSGTSVVTNVLTNIASEVKQLALLGGKNFIVPNLPDLGLTPDFNTNPANAAGAAALTAGHDQGLALAMGELQRGLAAVGVPVNIRIVDVSALINDVIADPTKYGAVNVTAQCVLDPTCVAKKDHYLFWDGVHPTAFGHEILANYFAASIDGPTTVGALGELDRIQQKGLFDQISGRFEAIRFGEDGLLVSQGGKGAAAGDLDDAGRLSVWVNGGYGWGSRDDAPSQLGFSYDHESAVVGADYRIQPGLVAGALVGYGTTSDSLHGGFGHQSQNAVSGAIYATWYTQPGLWLGVSGTYTGIDFDKIDRNTFVASQVAAATSSGDILGAQLEGGWMVNLQGLHIGPTAAFRLAEYSIDTYTETGAVGINETVRSQQINGLTGEFGVEAALETELGAVAITPSAHLLYEHEFRTAARSIITTLVTQSSTNWTTVLPAPGANAVRAGFGIDAEIGHGLSASVSADGTFGGSDGTDGTVFAGLTAKF